MSFGTVLGKGRVTKGICVDPSYEVCLKEAQGLMEYQLLNNLVEEAKSDIRLACDIADIRGEYYTEIIFTGILEGLEQPYIVGN